MSTAERATKRRRLSADKATTPAKSSGTAPESKSTGRSARSRTGVKADASEAVVLEVTPKTRRTPRASNAALENGNDQSDGNARTRTNGKAGSPATGQKKTPTAAGSARRRGGANAPNPSAVVVTAPAAEHERSPVPAIEVSPSEEDDANGSTSDEDEDADDAPVSRETFLHNEQLKRQREARNFVYEGDGNAPKLTRSGRVITAALPESENTALSAPDTPSRIAAHMNAGTARTPSRRAVLTEQGDTSIAASPAVALDATPSRTQAATPRGKKLSQRAALPEGAKKYLERTMAILTGAEDGTVSGPQPFDAEEGNETLRGLVNVLRGTVCRGEGNSALLVGPRGVGKSRTVARALQLLTNPPTQNDEPSRTVSPDIIDGIIPAMIPPPATSSASTIPPAPPIIVRLSGHAQTNDRLAIREMGRQIAWAEGHASFDDGVPEDEDQEYAPTTLPSHLLALLTAPSARAIVVIMEEFDLFTEHARQALLYCLLDVVQSIKTGPVESTGRGVALIGITSRTDTLLLLEKRVKSRFSHRVWRVTSPLAPGGLAVPEGDKAWKMLLRRALVPKVPTEQEEDAGTKRWLWDWEFAIDMLLKQDKIIRHFDRLSSLTTDVRNLYRPFIPLIPLILSDTNDFLSVPLLSQSLLAQVDGAGWGIANAKLKGLSQPALTILVAAKHLAYAGKDEFNFAQVNEEYVRFARTRLVGSGRVRWAEGVLRRAFDQVISLGLLVPVSNATIKPHFARYRCTLSTHEIVAWFKGEGASSLGPELGNWGRMMGGHA